MTDQMQRLSYVYFARAENSNRWKLGVSVHPEGAIKAFLQPELTVVYTTPGDRRLKTQIGFHLTRHRISKHSKDWYHLTTDEIEPLLNDLQEQGPEMLRHVRRLTEDLRSHAPPVISARDLRGARLLETVRRSFDGDRGGAP